MKVLVATKETQGKRKNDFNWTKEGELVYFGTECTSNKDVDDECGCHRAMSGMETHKGTTTMKVVDLEMNKLAYKLQMLKALESNGFLYMTEEKLVDQQIDDLLALANYFHDGDVVERRGILVKRYFSESTKEFRITRPSLYLGDCIGNKDKSARQGHYIKATSMIQAIEKAKKIFPNEEVDIQTEW